MDDPFADEHIVRDISTEQSRWRWAFAHPEVRLAVTSTRNLKFAMEFVVPEVTFRDTGPIEVSCSFNEKPLGSVTVARPDEYHFEKPVPEGWVKPNTAITVKAEASKRFIAKGDGAQLSFLLGSVGFTE